MKEFDKFASAVEKVESYAKKEVAAANKALLEMGRNFGNDADIVTLANINNEMANVTTMGEMKRLKELLNMEQNNPQKKN